MLDLVIFLHFIDGEVHEEWVGVGTDKEKEFSEELGAGSRLGRGSFLPPPIWVDKRGETTWKRRGENADLCHSLFSAKKCTNRC